jgi:alpha-beta hydrolase superfamily lysophospholipase
MVAIPPLGTPLSASAPLPAPAAAPRKRLASKAAPREAPEAVDRVLPARTAGRLPYRAAIRASIAEEQRAIAAEGLVQRPDNRSFARFHAGAPARGLAVMFHGLDAGTAQWNDHVQAAFDAGYDVFVPALPGHGLRDKEGNDVTDRIPNSGDPEAWDRYIDSIHALTRSAPLTLLGLSAGGMCALRLAERHREDPGAAGVRQVIAVSPFLAVGGDYLSLGPIHITNAAVARVFQAIEKVALTPARWFLKTQKVDFHTSADAATNYGAKTVDQDIILGLIDTADRTVRGAKSVAGLPIEIIVSGADTSADPAAARAFAKKTGATLVEFPAEEQVPHAMIYHRENHNSASLAAVKALIQDRLTRDA